MPNCKGCGAEVKWVFMQSGKRMPVDAKPIKMVQIKNNIVGELIDVYMPHWATCPKANEFKKKSSYVS